jgi:N-acetyl-anhydromuramyl-L-alanine amidase AmpD
VGLAWEGDTITTPLTDDAVQSAAEYLRIIIEDYKIPVTNILRHADIAPNRKNDCSPEAHKQLLEALSRFSK